MKILLSFLLIFLQNLFFFQETYAEKSDDKGVNKPISSSNIYNDPYLLGPGDLINIKFFGAEEFNNTYRVFNDGSINLPIVGKILILNLSVEDASKKIQNLLKKELLQPEIYLSIVEPRPLRIYISGEIKKPGVYTLNNKNIKDEGSGLNKFYFPTILDAVNNAGGFTQKANLKKIEVKRLLSGIKMEYKIFTIDLANVLDNKYQNFNLYLKDGDFISIFKAESSNQDNIISLSKTNLVDEQIKVNVIGEVKNPGELTLKPDTTLSQAVLSAGGLINIKANKGRIKLLRINKDGSAFYKSFKINFNDNISNKSNPILKDGDIVEVNSNLLATVGEGIDTLIRPFLMPLYLLR